MMGIAVDCTGRPLCSTAYYGGEFSMPAGTARQAKPYLRVALGVKLVPRLYHTEDYHSPTVDNPLDNSLAGTYLGVKIDRIIVFDSRTGEILTEK